MELKIWMKVAISHSGSPIMLTIMLQQASDLNSKEKKNSKIQSFLDKGPSSSKELSNIKLKPLRQLKISYTF